MIRKIEMGIKWLRSKLYSIKYHIGSRCQFEKIKMWHCPRGSVYIGNHVNIYRRVELRALKDKPIHIGDNVLINFDCIIRPNIRIGDNVSIGPGVHLISDNHKIGTSELRAGESSFDLIKIANGCWVGADVTILGNVEIGKGTVIAAGAVVNKDCEPNSLYAGVPAKLVKRFE